MRTASRGIPIPYMIEREPSATLLCQQLDSWTAAVLASHLPKPSWLECGRQIEADECHVAMKRIAPMPDVLVARLFASLGLILLDDGLHDLLLEPCVEQFRLKSSAPAFDRSPHRLRRRGSASAPVPVQMCFAFSWMTVVVSLMSCPHCEDQPTRALY